MTRMFVSSVTFEVALSFRFAELKPVNGISMIELVYVIPTILFLHGCLICCKPKGAGTEKSRADDPEAEAQRVGEVSAFPVGAVLHCLLQGYR